MTRFSTLRTAWREAPVLLSALALAVATALFFGIRLVAFWVYWADPAHRDQAIEGWMTPRYVVMSYDVPRGVVAEALALRPEMGRVTLSDLAEAEGVEVSTLAARLAAAIDAHRATRSARPKSP